MLFLSHEYSAVSALTYNYACKIAVLFKSGFSSGALICKLYIVTVTRVSPLMNTWEKVVTR